MNTLQNQTFTLASKVNLAGLINTVRNNGQQQDRNIQIAAVHALGHVMQHPGAIEYVNRLYEALPKGINAAPLRKYLEQHGPLAFSKASQSFAYFRNDALKFDGAALMMTPWYDIPKSSPAVLNLDVQKRTDALIKEIESAIDKGRTVMHSALLDELKAAAMKYAAKQYVDDSYFDWNIPDAVVAPTELSNVDKLLAHQLAKAEAEAALANAAQSA